jgi:hypothetical protein
MSAHAAQHRTPQERGQLPPTPPRPTVVVTPPVEAAMHPHVYRIALGCWACFLAVFWATFWVSSNALFQVVIATVYAVMFFGVPYEMSRIYPGKRTSDKSIRQFLREPFQTRTGTMRGYEALLQVILVPVLLTIGGTAIGIIIHTARAAQ